MLPKWVARWALVEGLQERRAEVKALGGQVAARVDWT